MITSAHKTEGINRTKTVRFYPIAFTGKERDEETGYGYTSALGGVYGNNYHYDALHRLATVDGTGGPGFFQDYLISPAGRPAVAHRQTGGDEAIKYYAYSDHLHPHALRRIYVKSAQPELHDLRWDEAGNLGQLSTRDEHSGEVRSRFHLWTEDSRLHTVVDDRHHSYYAYDHTGERTLKVTGHSHQLDVNADLMHTVTSLRQFTVYPSPYIVLTEHGYTKHYYAGAERLAARQGGGFGRSVLGGCPELADKATILFDQSLHQAPRLATPPEPHLWQEGHLDEVYDNLMKELFDLPEELVIHAEIKVDEFLQAMQNLAAADPEPDVYFYHSDHLGSANWITDATGTPVQHLQYLPYGEPYINQRVSGYSERFTFTGKERDEETGYGYFGARYMDHELMTMWLSVDPMADKYPNISPYAYCIWNPIVLIDPDGNEGIVVSGGEYDGDRYKYNFIEPAITKLKALKAAAGNEPITWVVMTAGYSESDMASFQKIARDLGVGFQAISSADEFTNYLNAKSIGSAELSEARRNDPITSISVFGHGYAGSAEFAYNQPDQGRFSWGTGNVKQLDAGAFKNATVDFYTCNSATDPEKGKSLGYVFSQQTGAVVTGYRGKSTYAKMNVGEGIGAKWDRLWEGFNPNGSVRLPQAGEGAIRIKFLPPVMNGNQ